MKNFYLLLLAVLGFALAAEAQVIVYHENFNNTIAGVSGNFTQTSAAAYTDTLYTAGSNMQANALASELEINNYISTYKLRNITITWKDYRTQYWRKTSGGKYEISSTGPSGVNSNFTKVDNTAPVSLEYSVNGGPYVKVGEYTASAAFFAWGTVNGGVAIALPAAVENQPNVRFRWKIRVNNTNTDFYAIDDIMIKGTPVLGTSTFSWDSRPLNENPYATTAGNPYKVDGVALTWQQTTIGTGLTGQTAAVTTDFQKKKTLALFQAGAQANTGTEVSLQLSHIVSGLTFTVHDVDRLAGQYTDKLEVVGYNGTQRVPVTKNNILPRIANEYSSGFIQAKVNGVDAQPTSGRGDVTISFVGDVDKVLIRYYNNDAAAARQGIAIGDLTWGMPDLPVGTLPVELASFKASSQNGNATLYWVTASEQNNEKFVVERSQDGKTFVQVGEVKGRGTSSIASNYSFTDTNPADGLNYYRLRQVDFDGTEDFSQVVALEVAQRPGVAATALSTVFPTAASSDVTIRLHTSGSAAIVVMNAAGNAVAQFADVTGGELVVPVQHLNRGIYFVTVTNGHQRETRRFIKQ
ncbi:T9SS type A sorting domain-containing protein [Pontibacter russatus]|uniref:T9SS type A sorting domain-containing protein n=1 Tax=Pontibacter russatus TaxID=2694929 RepID=UPI00137A552B|nr:T9SS type A sorting domain-containing protein [Pontibacter russatus]